MIIKKSVLPRHKLRVVTGKSVGTAGPGSDKNLAQTGPRSRCTVGTFPWLIPSGSKRSEFSERDLKIELRLSLGLERTQKMVPGKGEN